MHKWHYQFTINRNAVYNQFADGDLMSAKKQHDTTVSEFILHLDTVRNNR